MDSDLPVGDSDFDSDLTVGDSDLDSDLPVGDSDLHSDLPVGDSTTTLALRASGSVNPVLVSCHFFQRGNYSPKVPLYPRAHADDAQYGAVLSTTTLIVVPARHIWLYSISVFALMSHVVRRFGQIYLENRKLTDSPDDTRFEPHQ